MEKKEMIPSKTVSLGLLILVSQLQVSMGGVYKVGDSAGWTIAGSVDYRQWAAPKTFHVGDIICMSFPNLHISTSLTVYMHFVFSIVLQTLNIKQGLLIRGAAPSTFKDNIFSNFFIFIELQHLFRKN